MKLECKKFRKLILEPEKFLKTPKIETSDKALLQEKIRKKHWESARQHVAGY